MIKQSGLGLNSRNEANPFDDNGFLPLMTAPMYCVVDENQNEFLDLKIYVCQPRKKVDVLQGYKKEKGMIYSVSISEFEKIVEQDEVCNGNQFCVDTANGNMPKLHEVVSKAKNKYKQNIYVLAGNVSSVEAFVELAKTGLDGVRVGIGGGSGCNTTLNTGVGNGDLEKLIYDCYQQKVKLGLNAKIIADGISSYVNALVNKKEALDNGYAAINRLLYAGADQIMVGQLFAQTNESAGKKTVINDKLYVEYFGMSTAKAQEIYNGVVSKHSEGVTKNIEVKYSIKDWVNGSSSDNDYLPGFVNCLRSAMSYTGSRKLLEFKNNQFSALK